MECSKTVGYIINPDITKLTVSIDSTIGSSNIKVLDQTDVLLDSSRLGD